MSTLAIDYERMVSPVRLLWEGLSAPKKNPTGQAQAQELIGDLYSLREQARSLAVLLRETSQAVTASGIGAGEADAAVQRIIEKLANDGDQLIEAHNKLSRAKKGAGNNLHYAMSLTLTQLAKLHDEFENLRWLLMEAQVDAAPGWSGRYTDIDAMISDLDA